jgi:hypothetical protein
MPAKVKERYVFHFIYRIFTISLQRELLWFSPLAASFPSSPMDFYHISPERIFMDFAFNGCKLYISQEDLHYLSPKKLSQVLLSTVFIFILLLNPQQFCPPKDPFTLLL